MTEINWDDYPNFTRWEMTCHCGCDRADMDRDFMRWLQFLRTELDHPMVINSGYRCPDHNAAVSSSGSRDGPHTTGKACDIAIGGPWADALLGLAYKNGARGKGIAQADDGSEFLHLDLDPRREALWSYK